MNTATRASPLRATIDVMVMRIVTRCATTDEFVEAFRALITERTLFIPSAQARAIGIETGFSLRLADGTPMLRGRCVVLEAFTTADNPNGRRGVRLGIRGLTPDSQALHQRILGARSAPAAVRAAGTIAPQRRSAKPTAVLRRHDTQPTPRPPETRTRGSALVLPANPLSELTDETLDLALDTMCDISDDE